ncbi:MAG: 23S rRNA (pseudouridine(1915)-N(3))-methyltransferase RlmH [Bacteriovoracaceae bacterium]|nr:23S rRNA (pseudouridine(1915)-N(3))-methyltransferase RlmH [Bacteriovoracaceae bacterium]
MREVHLITVGALKDTNLEFLENDYLKRLTLFKFSIHELKAHSEDLNKEAKEVIKKLNDIGKASSRKIVLLEERGKKFSSPKFSEWFNDFLENHDPIIFIIGGAAGHGKEVLDLPHASLSLSEMTFPHKIARLLLIEQIYRAETIIKGHPYHK